MAAGDLAISNLESSLGAYPSHDDAALRLTWDPHDVLDMINDVPDHPNIWSDGSAEPIPHLD